VDIVEEEFWCGAKGKKGKLKGGHGFLSAIQGEKFQEKKRAGRSTRKVSSYPGEKKTPGRRRGDCSFVLRKGGGGLTPRRILSPTRKGLVSFLEGSSLLGERESDGGRETDLQRGEGGARDFRRGKNKKEESL